MAFSTSGTSSDGSNLFSEINVTPLIDVLLIMLILFMVIAPVVPRGLEASAPSTEPAPVLDQSVDVPVFVQIDLRATDVLYRVDCVGVDKAIEGGVAFDQNGYPELGRIQNASPTSPTTNYQIFPTYAFYVNAKLTYKTVQGTPAAFASLPPGSELYPSSIQ